MLYILLTLSEKFSHNNAESRRNTVIKLDLHILFLSFQLLYAILYKGNKKKKIKNGKS